MSEMHQDNQLNENNCQPRILYLIKLSFHIEIKMNTFQVYKDYERLQQPDTKRTTHEEE